MLRLIPDTPWELKKLIWVDFVFRERDSQSSTRSTNMNSTFWTKMSPWPWPRYLGICWITTSTGNTRTGEGTFHTIRFFARQRRLHLQTWTRTQCVRPYCSLSCCRNGCNPVVLFDANVRKTCPDNFVDIKVLGATKMRHAAVVPVAIVVVFVVIDGPHLAVSFLALIMWHANGIDALTTSCGEASTLLGALVTSDCRYFAENSWARSSQLSDFDHLDWWWQGGRKHWVWDHRYVQSRWHVSNLCSLLFLFTVGNWKIVFAAKDRNEQTLIFQFLRMPGRHLTNFQQGKSFRCSVWEEKEGWSANCCCVQRRGGTIRWNLFCTCSKTEFDRVQSKILGNHSCVSFVSRSLRCPAEKWLLFDWSLGRNDGTWRRCCGRLHPVKPLNQWCDGTEYWMCHPPRGLRWAGVAQH